MKPTAFVILIVSFIICLPASAAEDARSILVLHRNTPLADVATRLGAQVEADLGDRLVVTASPAVLDALRRHPAVKYVQTIGVRTEPVEVAPPPGVRSDTSLTWISGDYAYDGAANAWSIGSPAAPGTQGYRTYGYDAVARLTKAQVGGVTPGSAIYEYSYDAYGNRTGSAVNQQWVSVPVDPATNRLTDANYDESGNQLNRGVTLATYDGFGMVTRYFFDAVNSEVLAYDANDDRIGVLRGATWTWSLRDAAGRMIRQYQSSSTNPGAAWLWVEDFVYRDGLLLGSERVAQEGGRRFHHLDHLGSPRLVTGSDGSILSEHDFLPFGEERTAVSQHVASGFDREEPLRFTGQERDFDVAQPNDSSAYIDYLHARYQVPKVGRFLSVDPLPGTPPTPQSWNRYAYVLGNPVNYVDPTGLTTIRRIQGGAGSFTCIDGRCTADTTVTARDPLKDLFIWMALSWRRVPAGSAVAKITPAMIKKLKQSIDCSAIPNGSVSGLSMAWGLMGSGVYGGEVVTNYDTGQVSAFGFGGFQGGINGAVSATAYTGLVGGLSGSNSNYAGGFSGASGSLPNGYGAFAAAGSGGLSDVPGGSLAPTGPVRVAGVSYGKSAIPIPFPTGGVSGTHYFEPVSLGKYWTLGVNDAIPFVARRLLCH